MGQPQVRPKPNEVRRKSDAMPTRTQREQNVAKRRPHAGQTGDPCIGVSEKAETQSTEGPFKPFNCLLEEVDMVLMTRPASNAV